MVHRVKQTIFIKSWVLDEVQSSLRGEPFLERRCYRRREYDICGVNAGADDHQPPYPLAGGGHGGHEAVHRALSRLGGAVSHKMDRMSMGIFTEYVG